MTRTVLVLGGTSAIVRPILLRLCQEEDQILLTGRDLLELRRVAADLDVRTGSSSLVVSYDACRLDSHSDFVTGIVDEWGCPDVVIAAAGVLGDQDAAGNSPAAAAEIALSNYVGISTVLAGLSKLMEDRGSGQIVVLSSVAGDRGRASNYTYGAAKAGMNAYLQGLRNRLNRGNVNVLTVKLGFVDTPMIHGKEGVFLAATPEGAAKGVCRAMEKRKDVVYVPGFWRLIMLIIRLIPESIFKRMSL